MARVVFSYLARPSNGTTEVAPDRTSNQFDDDAMTDQGCGALQAGEGDVVFGVEDAIDLGAAGFEQRGHAGFGNLFLLHGLG
jgi:hypothetical protein